MYGRLYGNSDGKLRGDRGDRGDRDRPDRTLLYPGDRDDRVKFMCDHMETTPGDSNDWEDRNVSRPIMHRFVTGIPCLLDTFKMALVSDNFTSALFMEEIEKYECMNAYTINFARITKISSYC